jgi:hypothetical protein
MVQPPNGQDAVPAGLDIPPADWQQTPPSVQTLVVTWLQRLWHMATAPPTGGAWRAWYARMCHLIDQDHDRPDDAGRCVRRLLRELDALWVFLAQHGVEPTNTQAERA